MASRPTQHKRWTRVANLAGLVDVVLVSAVTTIVLTRSYLAAAGYPQIGGNGLHVSHMLWGGLLMFAALLSQMLYIGRDSRLPSAVIGGIGFGLFIDELGKFITSDNDYFFKPTFALIYVCLIAFYLISQTILRRRQLTPQQSLANAIEFLEDAALGNLTEAKRDQALDFLGRAGEIGMVDEIRRLIEEAPLRTGSKQKAGVGEGIRSRYDAVSHKPWFSHAVSALAVLQVLLLAGEFAVIAVLADHAWRGSSSGTLNHATDSLVGLSFVGVIEILTAVVAGVFVFIGIRRIGRDERLRGYRMFERSVLVSIFVTQLLAFFQSWSMALVGLSICLPTWLALRLVIQHEETEAARDRSQHHAGLVLPNEIHTSTEGRQPVVL